MSTTDTHADNLRMYVNDMLATEQHIREALARQIEDERVKAEPKCAALIGRIHATLQAHVQTLEEQAAAYKSETGAAIKGAITQAAGVLAGLYDKVRKHPVSRMLRDDHVALTLAATAYSMLHTTGLALREVPLATISLRHLKEITPLVMELGELIPSVVVRELAEDEADLDSGAAELARENIAEAWGSAEAKL
jgi:hypothetical protein